ncbi:UDP-N-acetyl-D-mannosamine dehydrogenase [Deinococcus cellulosilyticus]|uniref:UDP-N-acetyl-D-mannosamine dehydrogenase n=1 Tax=Deinococcus cellulosilyticus (strain DSM 18568 / NBRC 106333 / KACC 11606 / 5516J-15) TaxID=1223518 RepID=A0A511N444_DEIC1|nr:UDP-N-acetyl-D-mannosamine dehydrogenase [Deinococcus cellulosilyticus]GEM47595.1 UDP-N-acetyl-D-mannosamine dehydrogenase [Deinococcus cellulosilyticus NBRC 106333 = KACC 11606]
MKVKRVCVIGMGYIGLPTATLIASRGFSVTGVDVKQEVVNTINQGKIHIVEPDLDWQVKRVVESGHLTAVLSPVEADVFVIAVPTPFKGDHQPDITYVEKATLAIAPFLREGNLVILESTSPVGTTEHIASLIDEARPDLKQTGGLFIAYCPERVLPGQIMRELIENDRIVGGIDAESTQKVADFYRLFVTGKVVETSARTAEMTKLTENSFRDVNIAFANELAMVCEELNVNVWDVIAMANLHPRVNILRPGPGVGGHCIAVDPWFIVAQAPQQARIIRQAREINDSMPDRVVQKVKDALGQKGLTVERATIACLGLAYKANVDDMRESPAVQVTERLAHLGTHRLLAVEPHVTALPAELEGLSNVQLSSLDEALERSDLVVILVDHNDFKDKFRAVQLDVPVVDTRGIVAVK